MDRTASTIVSAIASTSLAGPSARRSGGALARLMTLLALRRSRRQLGRLDAHLLRDVGLTPEEARREALAPVWNAPGHWLR